MEFTLIRNILKSPRDGWQNLPDVINNRKFIGFNILITVAMLAGSLSFIGVYIKTEGAFLLAIRYFGYVTARWVIGILLASWALSKLTKGFKGQVSFGNMLTIITICSSFLMLFVSISHIVPLLRVPMYFLSAIGLVYYYFALEKLAGLRKEQIPGFLLTSILIIAIVLFFTELILAFFFKIPINL